MPHPIGLPPPVESTTTGGGLGWLVRRVLEGRWLGCRQWQRLHSVDLASCIVCVASFILIRQCIDEGFVEKLEAERSEG